MCRYLQCIILVIEHCQASLGYWLVLSYKYGTLLTNVYRASLVIYMSLSLFVNTIRCTYQGKLWDVCFVLSLYADQN